MMKRSFAIALGMMVLGNVAQAELITTIPSWNGTQRLLGFGESDTSTFGQTITVGADIRLESYSFRIRSENLFGAFPTRFGGYVMEWDEANDRAIGPILYDSGLMVLPFDDTTYRKVEITPGINLVSGHQYVLFFSTASYQDGNFDQTGWGYVRSQDSYVEGKGVFQNSGTDPTKWTSESWGSGFTFDKSDFAFDAQLRSVPEPSSILLSVLGAGILVFRGARRGLRNKSELKSPHVESTD